MHFTKNDYAMPDYPSEYRKLKKSTVPSLNLPISESVTESTLRKTINDQERSVRLINRCNKKKIDQEKFVNNTVPVKNSSIEVPNGVPGDVPAENVPVEAPAEDVPVVDIPVENVAVKATVEAVPTKEPESNSRQDSEIEVQCDVYKKFVNTEKDLNILTGLPSFDLLNLFEDVVQIVSPKAAKCYFKSKLSIKDRIVLTLTKLKQNISYSRLCVMFRISSEENCRKIFLRMISILSVGLKYAIH
ncbi:uncharacterized protein LOC100678209 [Nasonia vitripennis]|uniref:Transposase Helix-turn-helix domain-containing protein n=1 Tax=Nasonia vitripennis TaxID=7425 RepID=A0A7M7HEC9_NASVI|nr:uncharacterized protein LOC100678209 [Nasonia vitripennis]